MLILVTQVKVVGQSTDWPAWIAAVSSALTLLLVAGTAWIALRGLHDSRRTRHGQLVVELMKLWDDQRVINSARHFRSWGPEGTAELIRSLWAAGVETRYALNVGASELEHLLANLPPGDSGASVANARLLNNIPPAGSPRGTAEDYERDMADWYDLSIYPNVIDAIGVLVTEDALSVEVVDELWGSNIVDAWTRWERPVDLLRELVGDKEKRVWKQFETIADRLAIYEKRRSWTRRDRLWYWLMIEPYSGPTERGYGHPAET
jgi:hypothetical protein